MKNVVANLAKVERVALGLPYLPRFLLEFPPGFPLKREVFGALAGTEDAMHQQWWT